MMKKDKLKQIREKYGAKVGGAVARVKQTPDEIVDQIAAGTRNKLQPVFCERMAELGIDAKGWDDIDQNDPQISVMWKLCDPTNIINFQDDKYRPKFIASLSEDERAWLCAEENATAQQTFIKDKWKRALMKRKKSA